MDKEKVERTTAIEKCNVGCNNDDQSSAHTSTASEVLGAQEVIDRMMEGDFSLLDSWTQARTMTSAWNIGSALERKLTLCVHSSLRASSSQERKTTRFWSERTNVR
jgi:hypothetical protein